MLGKWHIADSFSKPEKLLRSATTFKYGVYTFTFLCAFLVFVSFANLVGPRLHTLESLNKALKKRYEEELEELEQEELRHSSSLNNGNKYQDDPVQQNSTTAATTTTTTTNNKSCLISSTDDDNLTSPKPLRGAQIPFQGKKRSCNDSYQKGSHCSTEQPEQPEPPFRFPAKPPTASSNTQTSTDLVQTVNHTASQTVHQITNNSFSSTSSSPSSSSSSSSSEHTEVDSLSDHSSIERKISNSSQNKNQHFHNHNHQNISTCNDFNDSNNLIGPNSLSTGSVLFDSPSRIAPRPPPFANIPSWLSRYIIVYTHKLPSNAIQLPVSYIVWFWSAVFLVLIFNETQYEFTYLAKRLGRVPVALLPPVYFLTLKPSPLPQTVYLQLIPFHKWLSRLVFLMVVAHALVYLYIYTIMGKLSKLLHWTNVVGILAFFGFVAMVLTSLKPIRRRFYNTIFYPTHYILSWAVLPCIYYHSACNTYPYVYGCLGLYAVQMGYKVYLSQTEVRLPVQYISSSMLFVAIPREKLSKTFQDYYLPGSHLRISSSPMLLTRLKSSLPLPTCMKQKSLSRGPRPQGDVVSSLIQSTHPYTIASLPQDPFLMLCIRKTRFPIKLNKGYTIAGPYSSIQSPFFNDIEKGLVKRVLFVAGGTGIAFCAPLMRRLINMGVPVKLLWAIRDMNDVQVLTHLGLAKAALENKQVEVYVTRAGQHVCSMKDRTAALLKNIETVSKKAKGHLRRASGHFTAAINGINHFRNEVVAGEIGNNNSNNTNAITTTTANSNSDNTNEDKESQSAFHGMFTPQTEDEGMSISIDNTLCDGGESRTIASQMNKSVPSYVDDSGRIVPIATFGSNDGNMGYGGGNNYNDNENTGNVYDEESMLQSSFQGNSYGSVAQSAYTYETPFGNGQQQRPLTDNNTNINNNTTSNTSHPTTQIQRRNTNFANFPAVSAPDLDYTSVTINSRPVLNLRLKSWLHGISAVDNDNGDGNTCCCIDQLLKTDMETDCSGRWILASGGEALVGETERWAKGNGFSFLKDEFSL